VNDPDLYDPWNTDDEAIVCMKVKKEPDKDSKYQVDRLPFKIVDVGLRPYQKKNVKSPDWCPVSKIALRDKKINEILF
jgi:hypothetical protein